MLNQNHWAKILSFFLLFLSLVIIQCNSSDGIYLKSFKNYELEEFIVELGWSYDSLFITIEQESYSTIVKVCYNGKNKALQPCWDGTFEVKNDSILLGVEYVESKDPYPNLSSFSIGTVVHYYEFSKIDTSKYRFYSDWFVPVDERVYLGDEEEEREDE